MAATFVVVFIYEEVVGFAKAGGASVAKDFWAPAFDGATLAKADAEAAVFQPRPRRRPLRKRSVV